MLSWWRPHGELCLVFWFQVSQHGWDPYAGSELTIEFQLSDEPIVGTSSVRRERFGRLLHNSAREDLRQIQNRVIASLRRPPPDDPSRSYSRAMFRSGT